METVFSWCFSIMLIFIFFRLSYYFKMETVFGWCFSIMLILIFFRLSYYFKMETVYSWWRAGYNMFFLEYYHPEELKKQNPDAYFPTASDMFIPSIVFGLFLVVVRYILDRQVLCYCISIDLVYKQKFEDIKGVINLKPQIGGQAATQ